MEAIKITDVGPRDGLQSQQTQVPTDGKVRLIEALYSAGLRSVEATSFVSPKAVPQMADADVLLPQVHVPPTGRMSVLVPNLRGLARARAAGATQIAVVLSATNTMNRKNIGMDLATATATCAATLAQAAEWGIATRAYVAVAFECPFEGVTAPRTVCDLALRMQRAGADEIVIADTIGAGAPAQVKSLLALLLQQMDAERICMHFHDTRGMGVANAWAALEQGVRRFDSSIGGLGGCPFAPGAAGNLATEDLVLLAQQCGFHSGVDLTRLCYAIDLAQQLVGYSLGGRGARWLRSKVASAD